MANGHGGRRPGAGRPRGGRNKPKPALLVPFGGSQQPLPFILGIMNNVAIDVSVRLRAAIAAAPYCHSRLAEGHEPVSRKAAGVDVPEDRVGGYSSA
jgi:hypothetical protein